MTKGQLYFMWAERLDYIARCEDEIERRLCSINLSMDILQASYDDVITLYECLFWVKAVKEQEENGGKINEK